MRSKFSVLLAVGLTLFCGHAALAESNEPAPGSEESGFALRGEGFLGVAAVEIDSDTPLIRDSSSEAFSMGGAASVAYSAGGFFGQLDAFGSQQDFDEARLAVHGGGAHVGWRDAERGTLGFGGTYNELQVENLYAWRAAVEGEVFHDQFTFGGSLGVFGSEADERELADQTDIYLQTTAAVYPVPDFRVHFSAGGVGLEQNNTTAILGAGLELMANAEVSPVSIFLRWEGAFGSTSAADIGVNSAMFGIRLYFGAEAPSLMAYDRGYFKDSCVGAQLAGRVC